MHILYEDDSLLVCIKPVGVLSQAAANGGPNMVALLEDHTGATVYPVHRLDKPVGGVMVFAKTQAAAATLSRQVAERRLQKQYLAWVHGVPSPSEGELEDLLFKDSAKNKVFVVKRPRKGVKAAKLSYRVLRECGGHALVEVQLFTGRTHQIRVQFASRKHPLLGDRKYGAHDSEQRLMLWSHTLRFQHPESGVDMAFTAPWADADDD